MQQQTPIQSIQIDNRIQHQANFQATQSSQIENETQHQTTIHTIQSSQIDTLGFHNFF